MWRVSATMTRNGMPRAVTACGSRLMTCMTVAGASRIAGRFRRSARSGLHVARLEFTVDGKPRRYDCTFVVRRAPRRRKAPILVFAATNTWRAYSGTPFALNPEASHVVWGTGGIERNARGLPAYNFYRDHASGQGTYLMGLRMPWPAAGPYVLYGGPTMYSHLARAERFNHAWLEEQGYAYDLISDLDLHRDPDVLRGYQVVMVVGHSEYGRSQCTAAPTTTCGAAAISAIRN